MKKRRIIAVLPITLLLFSCANDSVATTDDDSIHSVTSEKNSFTVTFLNEDGTLLEKDTDVKKGEMPHYDGETPTKEEDSIFSYVFAGWSPELTPVVDDVTYTASYDSIPKGGSDDFSSLTISETKLYLSVGDTYSLSYESEPFDINQVIQLKTNDSSIVSVSSSTIEAKAHGQTKVYFEAPGGLKSYCDVYVYEIEPNVASKTFTETEYVPELSATITIQKSTISNIDISFDTPSDEAPGIIFKAKLTKTEAHNTNLSGDEIPYPVTFSYRIWGYDVDRIYDGTFVSEPFLSGKDNEIDIFIALSTSEFSKTAGPDHYVLQFTS